MGELMLASAIISAVGAVASGVGQAKAASYQAQVAQNNATIAKQNARTEMQAGEAEATTQGLAARNKEGGMAAAMAAEGVDINSGSAASARASQEGVDFLDTMTIRNNAARRAHGDESQAMNFEAQSKLDKSQAQNDITSSLLSAASSTAGGLGKYYQNTGTF
jgi:hypothetical protein